MRARYLQGNLGRLATVVREKGLLHVLVFLLNHFLAWPICLMHRSLNGATIEFEGRDLEYLFHVHNHTWLNERMIEVPIMRSIIDRYGGNDKRILEVGNVLSHYQSAEHDIVDKYEVAPGVINADIVDFNPGVRYDLIVSISTLEHVGWDEVPRQPEKLLDAVMHLRELLSSGGSMYVSVPIGENPFLDECLRDGRLRFEHQYNFQRVAPTRWEQVGWERIARAQHNAPFRFGNAVVIGKMTAAGPDP